MRRIPLRGASALTRPGPSTALTRSGPSPLFDLAPGLLGIWADYFGLGVIVLLPRWCRRVARVSDQWVGFILTGQYFAVVLGQLVVGVAADRLGRHRTMAAVMARRRRALRRGAD